jgi:hypothetical protein
MVLKTIVAATSPWVRIPRPPLCDLSRRSESPRTHARVRGFSCLGCLGGRGAGEDGSVTQSDDLVRSRYRGGGPGGAVAGENCEASDEFVADVTQQNGKALRSPSAVDRDDGTEPLMGCARGDPQKISRGSPISGVIAGARTGLVGMSRTKGSNSATLSYASRRVPLGPRRPAGRLSRGLGVIWLSASGPVCLIEDPQERTAAL